MLKITTGTANADVFVVKGNGNVGIGTTTVGQTLVVYGNGDGNSGITIKSPFGFRSAYLASDGSLNFNNGTNVGFLNSLGNWIGASDRAYKTDIIDMAKYGLDTVLQMKPREYKMKADLTPQIGFIAQEMETIVPEVVSGQEGHKGISYGQITPILAKAIQELNSRTVKVDSGGSVGIGTAAPTSRLQVVGLAEYADNAAAKSAGLTDGAFYRTGDILKVAH